MCLTVTDLGFARPVAPTPKRGESTNLLLGQLFQLLRENRTGPRGPMSFRKYTLVRCDVAVSKNKWFTLMT